MTTKSKTQVAKKTAPAQVEVLDLDQIDFKLPGKAKTNKLEKQALGTLEQAQKMKPIVSTLGYAQAAEFAKTIKEGETLVSELYDDFCDQAHKLHKGLTTKRGALLKPLQAARVIVQGLMNNWTAEQTRLAQEKAQAEAEAERKKLIAQAQRRGDKAEVKELKSLPVVADDVQPVTPKIEGVSTREVIKWRLADLSQVPREFLILDEAKIRNHVKAHGMETKIAGIEVYKDAQTQIRNS